MLKYMLIARAQNGHKPMDLKAHGDFSCQMGGVSYRLGKFLARIGGVFSR